ncbi:hypothetical protein C8R44DRAFT_745383 [Mycena epipterygia]|nr:hypothetical protein C8R44DRAFT_745383 [Mycena epipterygia]
MEKHFVFIKALDDFELLFPVWYPVDKLRNKIINNLAFNTTYWTSELGSVLNAWKAAKAISAGSFSAPASKITVRTLGQFMPPMPHRQHPSSNASRLEMTGASRLLAHATRTIGTLVIPFVKEAGFLSGATTEFVKGHNTYFSIYEAGALKIHAAAPGAECKLLCIGFNCSGGGRTCDGDKQAKWPAVKLSNFTSAVYL